MTDRAQKIADRIAADINSHARQDSVISAVDRVRWAAIIRGQIFELEGQRERLSSVVEQVRDLCREHTGRSGATGLGAAYVARRVLEIVGEGEVDR